jgi:hypothetical protein
MKATGEMENIEDALMSLHTGQWFGFTGGVKTYANLIIHDDSKAKPSEAELNAILAANAAKAYRRSRAAEYPSIGDQLDMQYHDNLDGTTTWKDAIAAVKTKYEKPS